MGTSRAVAQAVVKGVPPLDRVLKVGEGPTGRVVVWTFPDGYQGSPRPVPGPEG